MNNIKIKSDKYTKARGSNTKLLTLSCGNCNSDLLFYQKDGAGNLFRIYLDKILAPTDMVEKMKEVQSKKNLQAFKCPKCNTLLAMPMIYEKENRLALRIVGPVHKKNNRNGIFSE